MSEDERRTEVDDDQSLYVLCMPVAWRDEHYQLIPGTTEFECEECGQPIFVAPSGQRMMASNDARAVCVPCGQEIVTAQNIEMSPATDDQVQELKDALLRERL